MTGKDEPTLLSMRAAGAPSDPCSVDQDQPVRRLGGRVAGLPDELALRLPLRQRALQVLGEGEAELREAARRRLVIVLLGGGAGGSRRWRDWLSCWSARTCAGLGAAAPSSASACRCRLSIRSAAVWARMRSVRRRRSASPIGAAPSGRRQPCRCARRPTVLSGNLNAAATSR